MLVRVQTEDFDISKEEEHFLSKCKIIPGAVSIFIGYVRDFSDRKNISSMTIEHYPGMTEKNLNQISEKAFTKWPLIQTLIIHRYGTLEPRDRIVLSICASLHRKAAFEANEFIMDHLKTKATFWKSEQSNEQKFWVKEKLSDKNELNRWENIKT
tara:strand:- start:580 stop:1044 length:465 start_codon:yes stop_codon:yes gene_type:complete